MLIAAIIIITPAARDAAPARAHRARLRLVTLGGRGKCAPRSTDHQPRFDLGWVYVKYERLDEQMQRVSAQVCHQLKAARARGSQSTHAQAAQLERSADAARQGSVWSELLEPVAKRWSGALKTIAYAIVAVSSVFIVVGLGAWIEVRRLRWEYEEIKRLRAQVRRLEEENRKLRQVIGPPPSVEM